MGIHWQELVVILLIVLVLFGPKRLPEVGSSLGKGIRSFKESLNGLGSTSERVTATSVTDAAQSASTTAPVAIPVPVEIVEPNAGSTTSGH